MEQRFDGEIAVSYGTSETGAIAGGPVSSATFSVGYVGGLLPGVKILTSASRDEPAPLVLVNDRDINLWYYFTGNADADD